jgi:hypothetical protein
MKGCHEKRFVAFNDISAANSKYKREQFFRMDPKTGRGRVTDFNPEPQEEAPPYFPDNEYVMRSLAVGKVKFDHQT